MTERGDDREEHESVAANQPQRGAVVSLKIVSRGARSPARSLDASNR